MDDYARRDLGSSAIGNDYNLGFEDDGRYGERNSERDADRDAEDEMARYRPRNYRMADDDDARNGNGNGRQVLPARRSRLRAGKSSFRLAGKSIPNNGFSLSDGVPEISNVLPSKQRSLRAGGYRARPVLNVQLPNIRLPRELIMALGGALALAALVALVGLVIVPAVRTSSFFKPSNATPAVGKPQIGVTIIAPIAPKSAAAKPGQSAPAPAVPVRADGLQIALDAREHAWVRVKVDGNVVYEGMPAIGPTVPWSAKGPNRCPVRESVTFVSPKRQPDGGSKEKTFQFPYWQPAFA